MKKNNCPGCSTITSECRIDDDYTCCHCGKDLKDIDMEDMAEELNEMDRLALERNKLLLRMFSNTRAVQDALHNPKIDINFSYIKCDPNKAWRGVIQKDLALKLTVSTIL